MKNFRILVPVAGLLGLFTLPVAPTLAQGLEEIVVTAARREQNLQEVAIPVTVMTGDFLNETGAFNVNRLKELVPTLQFYSSNPRNSAANIRGLGAPFGLTNDGIEQGVGLYVDDVYYSRAASSTLDFLDVQRIEVLRGPQGTLYGKNTTAGAINITTLAPTFEPEGSAEVSIGNLGFLQAKAALSGPIAGDNLAGRFTVSSTSRHGTVENVATSNRVNELDNIGTRGQLLWRVHDGLDVTLVGDYNKQDPECCAQIFGRVGTTQRALSRQYWQLSSIQDTDPTLAGVQPYAPPGTDPFDRVTDVDAELNAYNELGGVALRAMLDLGVGKLTSVTAWRYWDWGPANDRDFTGLPVFTKVNNPSTQDQYTQEFRYAWSGEQIDYVFGLFGYKQTVHTDGIQEAGPAASLWLLNPTSAAAQDPATLNGLTAFNDIDFENTSAALFGQVSWRVNDRFRIEPGLRINYDDKQGSYDSVVVNATGTALTSDQRGVLAPQSYEAEFSDWNISGDLKLAYALTQDINAYASLGRSFKTGGITLNGVPLDAANNPILSAATVEPEKLNSYELGLKTSLLDSRATLNIAGFWTDVNDYQATVTNGQLGVIRGYLANADQVRNRGVETDFSFRPTENWNFYVNGAYTDGIYKRFTDAPCPPELAGGTAATAANPASPAGTPGGFSPPFCDVSGQWLPGLSKWSGSWGFQYDQPATVLGRDAEVYFGYDGSARTRWSSNASRSIYTDVAGYALTNFRLGFRSGDSWDVFAWVKNALDRDYFEQLANTSGNTGLIAAQPADPRTFGVTVRGSF